MTGSVQEKNGIWQIVLHYKGRDGNKHYKWVSTRLKTRGNKKKAEAMIPDIIAKYKSLEYIENEMSMATYAENWLKDKKISVRQSTWECYATNVNTHIIPYFRDKGISIQDIKPKDVKAFYDSLLSDTANKNTGKRLSNATIKKIAAITKSIFDDAVALEYIPKNPARSIPTPRRADETKTQGVYLTINQSRKLLKAFDGHELEALVFVALIYGLRRSELVGLRWQSVDFEHDMLYINHTVVHVSTIIEADTTKTETSRRTFVLLPDVKKALLKLKSAQEKNRKLFGNCYFESDYVFTWQDGRPFRPDSVTRGFKRVLKNNDLPDMRLHDLRHTCASLLHEQGWDVVDAMHWLGHSDIKTTVNVYTHISEERKKMAAESLNGLFFIDSSADNDKD